MDILEVIDKLKELDYDEVTIDSPDFKLSLKRSGSPAVSTPQAAPATAATAKTPAEVTADKTGTTNRSTISSNNKSISNSRVSSST